AMGHPFEAAWIPENIDYYLARTSHGSTLSRVVHAWVLARSDRARSFALCQEALRSDVDDIQGGTTSEGIHLGAMAGTVDIIKRGCPGAGRRGGALWLKPGLPDELAALRTCFRVRGAWLDARITRDCIEVEYICGHGPVHIGVDGELQALERGDRRRFELPPPGADERL